MYCTCKKGDTNKSLNINIYLIYIYISHIWIWCNEWPGTVWFPSIWPPIPGWDFTRSRTPWCDGVLYVKRLRPWKRSATIFGRTVCEFPFKDCSPPVFLLKNWNQDVKEALRERDEWQVWSIYLELGRLAGRHQEVLGRGSKILCQTQKVHLSTSQCQSKTCLGGRRLFMNLNDEIAHPGPFLKKAAVRFIFRGFQKPTLLMFFSRGYCSNHSSSFV